MIITELTREQLKVQRIRASLIKRGFEAVGEGGGRLWELYRGSRTEHKIVDVAIDPCGKSVWVKINPR